MIAGVAFAVTDISTRLGREFPRVLTLLERPVVHVMVLAPFVKVTGRISPFENLTLLTPVT